MTVDLPSRFSSAILFAVNRRDLIRHIEQHGGYWVREGSGHTIYRHPNGGGTSVPRHSPVKRGTARVCCRQLGIPLPPELG